MSCLNRHRLLSSTRSLQWHHARTCVPRSSWRTKPFTTSTDAQPTKVEKILLDTIKATGPISFARYMQLCLAHPTEGYYMNPSNPVFGSRGDFITSPEISQVFGELVGIWLLSQWLNTGQSKDIRLLELGPGRGTLMEDVLRVLSQFPAARSAVKEVHLVETSFAMRDVQKEKLQLPAKTNGWQFSWHDSLEDVPRQDTKFTMILAHEFFDALPFHLLEKTHQGWQEVLITSAPDPAAHEILKAPKLHPHVLSSDAVTTVSVPSPQFRPVLSPAPSPSSTLLGLSSQRFQKLPVGSRIEVSPASFKVVHRIGELIQSEGQNLSSAGCALIVDYGGEKAYGNSFRAFKNHKIVDIFHRPGECDLTVNVDFAYLKEALSPTAMPLGPLPQATFLTRMGLQMRVDALKRAAKTVERKDEIDKAAKRLIDLTGMGSQYQVMGVTGIRPSQPTPEERWPFVDP